MADRGELARAFLETVGWADAQSSPLAGDASPRSYRRLRRGNERAVLMDAAPELLGDCVAVFDLIARWLLDRGFSAPRTVAIDTDAGFLLSEDFGDDLFARLMARHPTREGELYAAATDLLTELHRHAPPAGLSTYDTAGMVRMAGLAAEWYLPGVGGEPEAGTAIAGLIGQAWSPFANDGPVVVLRDFHAENMIWLPERAASARIGLLDFQDAVSGHPAYDLVSALQDARRNVPAEIEADMLNRYVNRNSLDKSRFSGAYALLGVQRNLRILGVFARLSMHFGKSHYVDFIPRTWSYLQRNLNHTDMADLRRTVNEILPAPTPERLQRIKAKCGTVPTL